MKSFEHSSEGLWIPPTPEERAVTEELVRKMELDGWADPRIFDSFTGLSRDPNTVNLKPVKIPLQQFSLEDARRYLQTLNRKLARPDEAMRWMIFPKHRRELVEMKRLVAGGKIGITRDGEEVVLLLHTDADGKRCASLEEAESELVPEYYVLSAMDLPGL